MINTLHEKIYQDRGHAFVAEYYADLDSTATTAGLIITMRARPGRSRGPPPSAAVRAVEEGKTASVNGVDVARVSADSICVHSDTPNATRRRQRRCAMR